MSNLLPLIYTSPLSYNEICQLLLVSLIYDTLMLISPYHINILPSSLARSVSGTEQSWHIGMSDHFIPLPQKTDFFQTWHFNFERERKKTVQTVDFPKMILCYNKTKNKAQQHNQPIIFSYSNLHKRLIISDNNIVLRREDDTVS